MVEKTRTEHSTRNTIVSVVSRILAILMGFVTRVVFTHTLCEEYVGINGLFTDIIAVLCLSELGVSTAISYALYEPIAKGEVQKQKAIMLLYRRLYRIIAAAIGGIGILLIPFLDFFIKGQAPIEHMTGIYLMYLTNAVLSYFWSYKRTLLDAYQLCSIGVFYQTMFYLLQDVMQIILLVTTKNFVLFLSITLICTVGSNVTISHRANQLFPFLKEKQETEISESEKKSIFANIKAMLMHKIGNVIINNTDNLVLSVMIGIVSVGIYSLYYLVIGSVRQVLNQVFESITASVGNLGVEQEKKKLGNVFELTFFIGQWMFGFAAICLMELMNPFLSTCFGPQYVFPVEIEIVLAVNFYLTGMRQATQVFRNSLGLFYYDRYKAILEAVLNLAFSLILANKFGTIGVFLGTFFSAILTSVWIEPLVLYRYLEMPLRAYFKNYLWYAGIGVGTAIFVYRLGAAQNFFVRMLLCIVIPNGLWLLLYRNKREWKEIRSRMNSFLTQKGAWNKRKALKRRFPRKGF